MSSGGSFDADCRMTLALDGSRDPFDIGWIRDDAGGGLPAFGSRGLVQWIILLTPLGEFLPFDVLEGAVSWVPVGTCGVVSPWSVEVLVLVVGYD